MVLNFSAIHLWTQTNVGVVMAVVGLIGTIIAYMVARSWSWRCAQRLVPYDAPPEDFTARQVGYLYNAAYTSNLLMAALVDMELHGLISIETHKKRLYYVCTVTRLKTAVEAYDVSPEYQGIMLFMFDEDERNTFTFDKKKKEEIRLLESVVYTYSDTVREYLVQKFWLRFLPISVSALLFVLAVLMGFDPLQNRLNHCIALFYVVFNIILQMGLVTYTPTGKLLLYQVRCFALYLKGKHDKPLPTERHEAAHLFKMYLPYAIALNVYSQWVKQFERLLRACDIDEHAANDQSFRQYTKRYLQMIVAITASKQR